MREVLYRAISMAKGEHWLYGQPRHYAHNPHTEKWTMYDPTTRIETDIDEETLGQYTGLTDKNGVQLFEGDIFHIGDRRITYTVIWEGCGLKGKQNGSSCRIGLEYCKNAITIIGNIHDNPELLEGGKK